MSENSGVTAYPSEEKVERWEEWADSMDLSLSAFIVKMVDTGMREGSLDVQPDETWYELREERNTLKDELNEARDHIRHLEARQGIERHQVEDYISENPGVTYDELVEHMQNTIPGRLSTHLDLSRKIRYEDGEYYPADESE